MIRVSFRGRGYSSGQGQGWSGSGLRVRSGSGRQGGVRAGVGLRSVSGLWWGFVFGVGLEVGRESGSASRKWGAGKGGKVPLLRNYLEEVVVVQGASDERGDLRPHPEHVSHRGVDHHVHVPLTPPSTQAATAISSKRARHQDRASEGQTSRATGGVARYKGGIGRVIPQQGRTGRS